MRAKLFWLGIVRVVVLCGILVGGAFALDRWYQPQGFLANPSEPGEVGAEASEIDPLAELRKIGERVDGGYYTLVDEQDREITMSALYLEVGDSYIAADNRQYEVTEIDGDKVRTKYVGTVVLPQVEEGDWSPQTGGVSSLQSSGGGTEIGIYHTHSDESYEPTSGVSSKNTGDIYRVGETLTSALEKLGVSVTWSKNNHNPHDAGAYNRSRRTAVQLLKERPTTLIDVHRDATPPQVYNATVNGEPVTKVRIVVGRQNQNREANLEYAKRLKAVADQKFPGLIQGIFNASGDYNQDLGPRTILLEFGAHTNTLGRAENAADLFAQVIPAAAGITRGSAKPAGQQLGSTGSRSALILIAIVAVLALGFLALNVGGTSEFWRRLRGFLGREVVDINSGREPESPGDEQTGDRSKEGPEDR